MDTQFRVSVVKVEDGKETELVNERVIGVMMIGVLDDTRGISAAFGALDVRQMVSAVSDLLAQITLQKAGISDETCVQTDAERMLRDAGIM